MVTFTEAFAHFGIKLKNPQGHWSGRNGNTVVVTMWADFLRNREYRRPALGERDRRRPGFYGLVKDVTYALEN